MRVCVCVCCSGCYCGRLLYESKHGPYVSYYPGLLEGRDTRAFFVFCFGKIVLCDAYEYQ